jgi:hypothetical protein
MVRSRVRGDWNEEIEFSLDKELWWKKETRKCVFDEEGVACSGGVKFTNERESVAYGTRHHGRGVYIESSLNHNVNNS